MRAGERTTIKSFAIQNAAHGARPLAAPAMAHTRSVASARTRRAQCAVMSPAEFITLVAGWGAGLLFISALARYLS